MSKREIVLFYLLMALLLLSLASIKRVLIMGFVFSAIYSFSPLARLRL